MLKSVKRGVLHVSKSVGVYRAVLASGWRSRRLTILCYHSVSIADEHLWNPRYSMSQPAFEARMRALRDGGYSVLPFPEAISRLREGTLPRASVSVTFDDGMHDFRSRAWPILEKYDIPATVYLTTFYAGFNRPVFPVMCSYLLWKGMRAKLDLSWILPGMGSHDLSDAAVRNSLARAITTHANKADLSAQEKDDLLQRLAAELGVDYADLLAKRILHVMNHDEVRELAAKGVDFELHTHRHRAPLDRTAFEREIADNRRDLRELLGHDVSHFCYPSGFHHPQFLEWLRAAGVESATTCEGGLASKESPPLLLPRVVDGGQLAPIEFEAWLCGAGAWLPRRSTRRGASDAPDANGE